MTTEELKEIIVEYRKKSDNMMRVNEESAFQLERFADYVENNIDTFEDIDDEKELWDLFLEEHDEDEFFSIIFYEGEEDDSITDFLTKN
jgi:hypothetical protein